MFGWDRLVLQVVAHRRAAFGAQPIDLTFEGSPFFDHQARLAIFWYVDGNERRVLTGQFFGAVRRIPELCPRNTAVTHQQSGSVGIAVAYLVFGERRLIAFDGQKSLSRLLRKGNGA